MPARLFSGLIQTGAWTCLDEFNRINIEVLSVIAEQVRLDPYPRSGLCYNIRRMLRVSHTLSKYVVPNSGVHDATVPTSGNAISNVVRGKQSLSVRFTQLMVLRNARLARATVVVFEGRELPLKNHHVVVTMNPGYAGRAELPNNLQVKGF